MTRKLAALLALMAMIAFFGSWLLHRAAGMPTATTEDILNVGIAVMVFYFIFGLFLAKIGVSLLREMMADRRSHEEEQQFRARRRFERAIAGETMPAEPPAAEPPPAAAADGKK